MSTEENSRRNAPPEITKFRPVEPLPSYVSVRRIARSLLLGPFRKTCCPKAGVACVPLHSRLGGNRRPSEWDLRCGRVGPCSLSAQTWGCLLSCAGSANHRQRSAPARTTRAASCNTCRYRVLLRSLCCWPVPGTASVRLGGVSRRVCQLCRKLGNPLAP